MKKFVKVCSFAFALLLILCCLSACGVAGGKGKSQEELIIGRWVIDGKNGYSHKLSSLEFFGDGTYVSSHTNYEGSYSISNNRLRLQGILVDSITETFKVDENTLTFYDGEDIDCVYKRVSD